MNELALCFLPLVTITCSYLAYGYAASMFYPDGGAENVVWSSVNLLIAISSTRILLRKLLPGRPKIRKSGLIFAALLVLPIYGLVVLYLAAFCLWMCDCYGGTPQQLFWEGAWLVLAAMDLGILFFWLWLHYRFYYGKEVDAQDEIEF